MGHADALGRWVCALGCSGEYPWERLVWTEGVGCHLPCLGVWELGTRDRKLETRNWRLETRD